MNRLDFQRMHDDGHKITMVTCYDYWTAAIVAKSNVDCLLVGDSVAMVMHGFDTTVAATVDMMVMHTKAVAKGANNKFIVTDLPFLSYRKSLDAVMDVVQAIMQAGAHAVKLEGVYGNENLIEHLVTSGVPVMGHIGLTPQYMHQLGGFKVQGRDMATANSLIEQAKLLQTLGCFAIVLECIPRTLADTITQQLSIPTIGIGAGEKTSGQVLVLQDLIGSNDSAYKFVKQYTKIHQDLLQALNQYDSEVKTVTFPSTEHCFEAKV